MIGFIFMIFVPTKMISENGPYSVIQDNLVDGTYLPGGELPSNLSVLGNEG
jgi:hypothetical protein